MSPRHIHPDEMREIMCALEVAILADDRQELHEDLLVPVAVAWVARRPRAWRRRDLVQHLLQSCAPFTSVVQ